MAMLTKPRAENLRERDLRCMSGHALSWRQNTGESELQEAVGGHTSGNVHVYLPLFHEAKLPLMWPSLSREVVALPPSQDRKSVV